jgi:non-specific serine/threonine protein kinase
LKIEAGVAANLYRIGRVATLSDPPAARPLLEEALAHYRSTGEGRASCWCQLALGHAALANGERETAERWFAGARETLRSFEDGPGAWLSLSCALAEAQMALIAGNDVRASELLRYALAESRVQRNLFYESLALMLSCQTSLRQYDVAAAASAGREGLQIAQQLGSLLRQWQCLEQLAGVAMAANQPERASLLHGAADALGERLQGIRPIGAATPETETDARPDGVIDAQQHAALVRTGRRMTDAETLAEVLALERDIDQQQEAATTHLSKRELDVLSLLAKGETNSAIADRLFLSPRTVDTHVGSILRKMQVTSRLDAIEAATERGLLPRDEP